VSGKRVEVAVVLTWRSQRQAGKLAEHSSAMCSQSHPSAALSR